MEDKIDLLKLGEIINENTVTQKINKEVDRIGKFLPKPVNFQKLRLNKYALNPKKIKIWELSDKDLKDLFIKFVGFVGYYSPEINTIDGLGYAILDLSGEIHRGEALPEPIDEITDKYMGITDYQAESIIIWRDNDNILNIWHRGAGKTWKSAWITEFTIKYEGEKFLYFSLTDVAYIVADFVYIWASKLNAIVESETNKVYGRLSGRKASYQKFGLINGARFEIHGIRTSTTLGFHGWNIIFDDVIDEQHRRLLHLQLALQLKWNSQYSKIRRKKFVMDNTRKFAGDFFDFIIDQFEKKDKKYRQRTQTIAKKYTLCIDLKTPYKDLFYKGDIEGYREFVKQVENNQKEYDITNLIAPWFMHEDFEAMKMDDIESYYAEILGIPMRIMGGMVNPEDLRFTQVPLFGRDLVIGGTGVDCAQTEDEMNDYTAIVSCLMKGETLKEGDPAYPRFVFYKADILRILARNVEVENESDPYDWINVEGVKIRRGIIETVQIHYEFHKRQYPGIPYIVAWERNNAGIAIMEQALRSYRMKEKVEIRKNEWIQLTWPRFLVADSNQAIRFKKDGTTNVRLGITHLKEKNVRVYGELQYPIKSREFKGQQVLFAYSLENSLFIDQILGFPKMKHDDGPDVGGMIKDELFKRWTPPSEPRIPQEALRQMKIIEKAQVSFQERAQPWMKEREKAVKRQKVQFRKRGMR